MYQAAQTAYVSGDKAASRVAHDNKTIREWEEDGHNCGHKDILENERIEAGIAGACATLVAASALYSEVNADLLQKLVAVLGVSGAAAHGLQRWSSDMWYRRHYAREYAREKWELQNYAQGEKEEMVGLFSHKGLDRGRAETVVGVMSQAPEFFVGLMMTEELQLREPLSRSEFRAAAVAASYAAAALGPVLASNLFVARSFLIVDQTTAFFAVGILILAFLGARRAHSALLNVHTHVFEIVCLGFACALVPKLLVSAILSSNIP